MSRPIRVLGVDDSLVMRSLLRIVLASDPAIELAGMAKNGVDALDAVDRHKPDLILLDIEMPRMNGLEVLAELRSRHATAKIIMCSTLTCRGARVTLEALAQGATDYVTKPTAQNGVAAAVGTLARDLLPRIKALFPAPQTSKLHVVIPSARDVLQQKQPEMGSDRGVHRRPGGSPDSVSHVARGFSRPNCHCSTHAAAVYRSFSGKTEPRMRPHCARSCVCHAPGAGNCVHRTRRLAPGICKASICCRTDAPPLAGCSRALLPSIGRYTLSLGSAGLRGSCDRCCAHRHGLRRFGRLQVTSKLRKQNSGSRSSHQRSLGDAGSCRRSGPCALRSPSSGNCSRADASLSIPVLSNCSERVIADAQY